MKIVYVLYFNEWGWEEEEEQSGYILGVFTDRKDAENYEAEAKKSNDHGIYDIKKVELNKYLHYGW